jgi:hypothetical protein
MHLVLWDIEQKGFWTLQSQPAKGTAEVKVLRRGDTEI